MIMENSTYINQCPGCSRLITFSNEKTNLLTCSCGTIIHRDKNGVLTSKPCYRIPDAFGTVQTGCRGRWQGKGFTVLGRFRAWFPDFVINYWTILPDDGDLAYLAEGYGIYSILQKTTPDSLITPANLDTFRIGELKAFFKGENFQLERWFECNKWEVEGELSLPECEPDLRVYEFSSAGGRHITLIRFAKQAIIPFEVSYPSLLELNLTDTRKDGYPGKTFSCPHCSQPFVVKTYPLAQSGACDHCKGPYSLWKGTLQKESKENTVGNGPDILVGSSGTIKGIKYEVIGYALKEENNQYRSQWKEYTLFHPEEGFAFLSEYKGHWVAVREKSHAPVLPGGKVESFQWNGEPFQLFNSYTYKTLSILGEFPYNIFQSGDTTADEFISPPEMWIREKDNRTGITWFFGEHISRGEMEQNFVFPAYPPEKAGVGAIEPKNYLSLEKLIAATIAGVLCLVMVHLLMGMTKQKRVLLNNSYSFPSDSVNTVSFVAGPYSLDKTKSNLEFFISAPVDNSWLELEAVLVNKKTGTEYSLEKGVEYYHGYEEGSMWSEGSKDARAFLSQVPAGTYLLQVRGTRDNMVFLKTDVFHLKVTYDVNNDRNLFVGLLAMLVWPVATWLRIRSNEKDRWYNSPFSPYSYDQ